MLNVSSDRIATQLDFRPFRAWRYDPKKNAPASVIAPPYDVISPAEQKALYAQSPYNCVRLILNEEEPGDHEQRNRYTRARDFFQDWQRQGILVREPAPAFYFYEQEFRHPITGSAQKRAALLGLLKLEPFEKGIVIGHENTLAGPKQDRRRLLESTRTNFSAVFGLHEDAEGQILEAAWKAAKDRPVMEASDEKGVGHRLWVLKDPRDTEKIRFAMSSRKVYIADGHHRYQTALDYARRRRLEENPPAGQDQPYDFVLAALVAFQDPGLAVLPTHRILLPYGGWDEVKTLEVLKKYFELEPAPPAQLKKWVEEDMTPESSQNRTRFGFVTSKASFLLSLRDFKAVRERMPAGTSETAARLDVNVLAHFVFADLLNLPSEKWEAQLRFTRYADEALEKVRSGEAAAAFLLWPPKAEVLREMGKTGELMPQKSTYFYPKLASGLVFYSHED